MHNNSVANSSPKRGNVVNVTCLLPVGDRAILPDMFGDGTKLARTAITLLFCAGLIWPARAAGETTINSTNKNAYGANVGWINWEADITNGAVVGQYFCTGYVYGANIGWIHLGDTPTNMSAYINDSTADYGVNIVSGKFLRGFAYGANVGWINFETNGNPQISLLSGALSGSAYGANIGWISLSNLQALVQTDEMAPGPDTDTDNVPDYWEMKYATVLGTILGGTNDTDGDGVTDADEYGTDTDPLNSNEYLHISSLLRSNQIMELTFTLTKPSRFYSLETADGLSNATVWTDSGLGVFAPDAGASTLRVLDMTGVVQRIFRAGAHVPLAP